MNEQEVKAQIISAFDQVPYPGDDKIIPLIEYMNRHDEFALVFNHFAGHHWKDLAENPPPMNVLVLCGVSFFSESAYFFYLPFFILQVVEHASALRVSDDPGYGMILESLLCSIAPATGLAWEGYCRRMSGFTPQQLEAIVVALAYIDGVAGVAGDKSIDKAIKSIKEKRWTWKWE